MYLRQFGWQGLPYFKMSMAGFSCGHGRLGRAGWSILFAGARWLRAVNTPAGVATAILEMLSSFVSEFHDQIELGLFERHDG